VSFWTRSFAAGRSVPCCAVPVYFRPCLPRRMHHLELTSNLSLSPALLQQDKPTPCRSTPTCYWIYISFYSFALRYRHIKSSLRLRCLQLVSIYKTLLSITAASGRLTIYLLDSQNRCDLGAELYVMLLFVNASRSPVSTLIL
jgi:hypothetical protein